MTQENYEIRCGSKYLIRTAEEDDTVGVFMGYAMIGSESALVVRINGEQIRFIPVAQIMYMDLLESSEESVPKTKVQTEHLYG